MEAQELCPIVGVGVEDSDPWAIRIGTFCAVTPQLVSVETRAQMTTGNTIGLLRCDALKREFIVSPVSQL
jgi:hypothetical protein